MNKRKRHCIETLRTNLNSAQKRKLGNGSPATIIQSPKENHEFRIVRNYRRRLIDDRAATRTYAATINENHVRGAERSTTSHRRPCSNQNIRCNSKTRSCEHDNKTLSTHLQAWVCVMPELASQRRYARWSRERDIRFDVPPAPCRNLRSTGVGSLARAMRSLRRTALGAPHACNCVDMDAHMLTETCRARAPCEDTMGDAAASANHKIEVLALLSAP